MLARRFKGQLQLLPLTLRLYLHPAEARLQLQKLQLVVGEFFAPGAVLLDPDQAQSFFQDPHLILGELEAIPVNGQRDLELFKQRFRKFFLELVATLGILRFKGSKTAAQLMKITNKNAVTFIDFSYSFSLSEMVFRYQSLRRVPLRSIPPNKSESSSWLKLTRSAWSSATGQLNLPRSSRLAQLQRPLPSQYKILSLFLLALANKNRCPLRPSNPSRSRTIP